MPNISLPSDIKVEPSVSNHFAWIRTLLALQRTLMAATRTSVSLIGFGFTVAQFFEKLRSNLPSDLQHVRPNVPRDLGLTLIAVGVVSLAMFIWQYRVSLKYMRSGELAAIGIAEQKPMHQPSYLFAWTVLLIGIAAFVAVFERL